MAKKDEKPVEEDVLPYKYRRKPENLTRFQLESLYEDLKKDYKYSIDQVSNIHRRVESLEKRLETEIELTNVLKKQNSDLYEAGRYAVYGKPQLSPVDEVDEEEQDGREESEVI